MQHHTRSLSPFVLLLIALFPWFDAAAQPAYGVYPGVVLEWNMVSVDVTTIIEMADGSQYATTINGRGKTEILSATDDPNGIHRAEYRFVDFNASLNVEDVGTITIRLDESRSSTYSAIQGLNPGSDFPAHEDFYLFVRAELNGTPYSGITELHFRCSDVDAFYPAHGNTDVFELVTPVTFMDEMDHHGFTISACTVTLDKVVRAFGLPDPPAQFRCKESYTDTLTTIEIDGIDYTGTSRGVGTINVTYATYVSDDNHYAQYNLTELDAVTALPDFGIITLSLDPNNIVASTITGLVSGEDFPAQEDLLFYAKARLNNVEYKSRTPVHLRCYDVDAFPNHNGVDRFRLVDPVDFVDQNNVVKFILKQHVVTFGEPDASPYGVGIDEEYDFSTEMNTIIVDRFGIMEFAIADGTGRIKIRDVYGDPGGTHTVEHVVIALDVSLSTPSLGDITITLDQSRVHPVSEIRGINVGKDYPATEILSCYAIATINGVPYQSEGPVELIGSTVYGFPDHNGVDSFRLTKPVNFLSPVTGDVEFTLWEYTGTVGS